MCRLTSMSSERSWCTASSAIRAFPSSCFLRQDIVLSELVVRRRQVSFSCKHAVPEAFCTKCQVTSNIFALHGGQGRTCRLIIGFKKVFLTPTHLGIVLQYAQGGELFQRVKDAGSFVEDEARCSSTRLTEQYQFNLL